MRSLLLLSALLFCSSSLAKKQSAFKRGLIYISSDDPSDLSLFTRSGSDLSWYYNYEDYPESITSLSFVPMLFGLPDASTNFLGTMSSLLQSSNPPRYVLSFNEPDMPTSVGGSDISPHDAAVSYLANIAPLRNSTYNHIKVSLPSTSGSNNGIDWLQRFNASCYSLDPKHGCPADFISTHWYGDFTGLTSWLGQIHEIFPSLPIWITEFADPAVSLDQTQAFFNQSTSYLDSLDYVDRYAWFGTFRAENANVFIGPNISFLDDAGQLTDLGSWYLGGNATGNLPLEGASSKIYLHTSMMWLALGILFLIS
jgi:Glycosyl hydrolase catalytic core